MLTLFPLSSLKDNGGKQSFWMSLAFAGGTAVGAGIIYLYHRCCQQTPGAAEAHLWDIVRHSFTGSLIRAGDQLGLYEQLHQAERPISAAELAQKQGWSARWLQEFLLQQSAAGILDYKFNDDDDDDVPLFSISKDYAALLRDPSVAPKSLAGMFQLLLPLLNRSDAVVQAIQTGLGVSYDYGDGNLNAAIDRKNQNWFFNHLIDDVIRPVTQLPNNNNISLYQLLESGVNIADIGCGGGASAVTLAKEFPKSHVYAFEGSQAAMEILQQRIKEHGLTNVTVCHVAKRTLKDGPDKDDKVQNHPTKFSFLYAHDVLHDMTNPRSLIEEAKQTMASDNACWIVVDVKCGDSPRDNLQLPHAAVLYGFSCLLCLQGSTSEPNGAGMGTCGLPTSVAKRLMHEAGFEHFQERPLVSLPTQSMFLVA